MTWSGFLESIDFRIYEFGRTEDVKHRLRQTIKLALLAESKRIDSENSSSEDVLGISDFIVYVLVPEVAAYLIAQEMEGSYLDAIDIKNDSNEFGEVFQGNVELAEMLSLIQTNDQVSEEQAEHPVPLLNYSPVRDWNQHSPSPKSVKKSLLLTSLKSPSEFSSSKLPKVLRKSARMN
ncbi:hypothetical protein C8R44DRAFT_737499 [Mycena epipterygia]|nr:hypothetical protein C8R44DRAFT_737499 [Mycena epipterygia]